MTRTSWQNEMKKIVLSGLWTETCVALPTVQAIYDKYEVYIAEDMIRSAVDLRVPMVAVTLLQWSIVTSVIR
jgi:nicotinamidase-related amidase